MDGNRHVIAEQGDVAEIRAHVIIQKCPHIILQCGSLHLKWCLFRQRTQGGYLSSTDYFNHQILLQRFEILMITQI